MLVTQKRRRLMYLLYKDLKRILWIVLAAFACLATAVAILYPEICVIFILAFLCLFFTLPIVLEQIAVKRYNPLLKKLENCDTSAFIREHRALLAADKTETVQRKLVQLNLFAGLWDAGEFRTAWELLQSFDLSSVKDKRAKPTMEALYYSHLTLVHLQAQNPDAAQSALEQVKEIIKRPESTAIRAQLEERCKKAQYEIDFQRGDLSGAYAYYSDCKQTDDTPNKRTDAAWQLYRICKEEGRDEEAAEHLHFVAEQGGDTHYAKEAARILTAEHDL